MGVRSNEWPEHLEHYRQFLHIMRKVCMTTEDLASVNSVIQRSSLWDILYELEQRDQIHNILRDRLTWNGHIENVTSEDFQSSRLPLTLHLTTFAETVESLTGLTSNKSPTVLLSSTGVYAVAYRVALATFSMIPTSSQADDHNRITHQKFA